MAIGDWWSVVASPGIWKLANLGMTPTNDATHPLMADEDLSLVESHLLKVIELACLALR
jgi:hypothetical protein